ncbi:hypothetical protein BGW41_003137 [Actinomortierella wolfii]|nr:hypothetical protein BGW41_003137 [Actinomortierella wolfii]
MRTDKDRRDEAYNPFLVTKPRNREVKTDISVTSQEEQREVRNADLRQQRQNNQEQARTPMQSLDNEVGSASGVNHETRRRDHEHNTKSLPPAPSASSDPTDVGKRASSRSSDILRELNKEMKATRIELKAWEANFLKQHGRSPTQADIGNDDSMVKKYRAYGKLKKAIAAMSASSGSAEASSSSSSSSTARSKASSSSSKVVEQESRTPKKSHRTSNLFLVDTEAGRSAGSAIIRTPTKKAKEQVEYISPNVIGMMSPRKSRRTQDDLYSSPSTSHSSRPVAGDSVVSSPVRTPSRVRTYSTSSPSPRSNSTARLLFSPRKSSNLRPSGANALGSIEEGLESDSVFSVPHTPSRRLRTPITSRITDEPGSSSTNPFLSPSNRPAAKSPLFGGMNKSKKRNKMSRTASNISITSTQSQEQVSQVHSSQETTEIDRESEDHGFQDSLELDRSPYSTNPLLLTPRRSAASRTSRSLFRHSGATGPRVLMSPSRKSTPKRHPDFNPLAPNSISHSDVLFKSTTEAMDSMSIHDSIDDESLEREKFVKGSRAASPADYILHENNDQPWVEQGHMDDPSQHSPEVSSPVARAFFNSGTFQGINTSPSWRMDSNIDQLSDGGSNIVEHGAERAWASASSSSPRGSEQMPSLTFSQPSQSTPVSPGSDDDFLFVAPGIHAHHQLRHRRIYGRSTLPLSFSRLEDEEFDQDYKSQDKGKQRMVDPLATTKEAVMTMSSSFQQEENYESDGDSDADEESAWQDTQSGNSSNIRSKKKTQKRTTKLHRIVVSSSKSTAATVRATKRSTTSNSREKKQIVESVSEDPTMPEIPHEVEGEETAASSKVPTDESAVDSISRPSITSGWANSNKPLVKSDRSYHGVGYGRAGARRSTSSSSHLDGNYVAYNLQRKSGRSGRSGYRSGRYRMSSSYYGTSQAATVGRFDTESWKDEIDQDFSISSGVMTNLGSHQQSMLLSDDIGDLDDLDASHQETLPWYGHIPDAGGDDTSGDMDDPLVASISPRYMPKDSPSMKVNLGHILQKVWGYSSFRDGQLESIKRILNNESTLLVLPTGGGKSLSYQMPAYVFSKLGVPSLTLVISPMISLMYDQVKCLPPDLIGACWTSAEQTDAQFKDFMAKLADNTIKILFISPEKLTSASFLSLIESNTIPKISFLCVDEAHCLSEWSHNFRPAYLMLNHLLQTQLGSPCVLGLTGTATEATKSSICTALNIDRSTGVLSGPVIRKNLVMSVSLEDHREEALLNMLRSPRFMNMDAILIYVMKQSQADHLAAFLRVRNFNAESYHAGKSSQDRQRIQERFMHGGGTGSAGGSTLNSGSMDNSQTSGTASGGAGGTSTTMTAGSSSQRGIRILCATIAFGMGLNKSNIRSVIHFCMPKSLENYIQEIGRSGRDGRQSYCHMFLSQEDYLQHRSLAYSDGMDYETLRWLLLGVYANAVPERKDALFALSSVSSNRYDSIGLKKRGSSHTQLPYGRDNSFSEELSDDDDGMPPSKKVRQNDGHSMSIKNGGNRYGKKTLDVAALLPKSIVSVAPPEERLSIDPRENMYRRMLPRSFQRQERWVLIKEEQAEQDFDLKKEVLATLLSYIELDESRSIKCHGTIQSKCIFKLVQSEDRLVDVDQKLPLLDWIIRNGVKTTYRSNPSYNRGGRSKNSGGSLSMGYACDTMQICQTFEISHHELYRGLQKLRRQKWIVFEMSEPAWLLEILQDPVQVQLDIQRRQKQQEQRDDSDLEEDEEDLVSEETKRHLTILFLDQLSERLYQKVCAVERAGVAKVDEVYKLFHSVATPTWQMHPALEPRPLYKQSIASASDGSQPGEVERELTEPELVLTEGIQEYFARLHGEGIGDVFEEMKQKERAESELTSGPSMDLDPSAADDKAQRMAMAQRVSKSVSMYTYQPAFIQELQRNWRTAVEVDLRVFLSQQFQQLGDDWLQWQTEMDDAVLSLPGSSKTQGALLQRQQPPAALRILESPRVVSRIFHGMSSPCFPAMVWARQGSGGASQFWAKYGHFDFATLMQMANRVLKELKVKYMVQARSPHRPH